MLHRRNPRKNSPLLRFRRELTGRPLHIPPPKPSALPRIPIDSLDPTLEIRNYTILGSLPIPPYDLITLDATGALCSWTLTSNKTLALRPTRHLPAPRSSSTIRGVSTAYHTPTQTLHQTLLYHAPRPNCPATLELRTGLQTTPLYIPTPTTKPHPCYCFLTPTSSSTLLLLQTPNLHFHTSAITHTLPAATPSWTLHPHTPGLRTLNLQTLAHQYLRLKNHIPHFTTTITHLLPSKRIQRTKPGGTLTPHPRTHVAFGGWEEHRGWYHVIVFAVTSVLDTPKDRHPSVRVLAAKSFALNLPGAGEMTPRYEKTVFQLALEKVGVGGKGVHKCREEVEVLGNYWPEEEDEEEEAGGEEKNRNGSLREIRCDGWGFVIEGWKQEKSFEGLMLNSMDLGDEDARELEQLLAAVG